MAKAKHLDYYWKVDDIFKELRWQSTTKSSIQAMAKKANQSIVEPLTDQEKEEDYEVNLHISAFTSGDNPIEEKIPLQVVTIPQPQQTLH